MWVWVSIRLWNKFWLFELDGITSGVVIVAFEKVVTVNAVVVVYDDVTTATELDKVKNLLSIY